MDYTRVLRFLLSCTNLTRGYQSFPQFLPIGLVIRYTSYLGITSETNIPGCRKGAILLGRLFGAHTGSITRLAYLLTDIYSFSFFGDRMAYTT